MSGVVARNDGHAPKTLQKFRRGSHFVLSTQTVQRSKTRKRRAIVIQSGRWNDGTLHSTIGGVAVLVGILLFESSYRLTSSRKLAKTRKSGHGHGRAGPGSMGFGVYASWRFLLLEGRMKATLKTVKRQRMCSSPPSCAASLSRRRVDPIDRLAPLLAFGRRTVLLIPQTTILPLYAALFPHHCMLSTSRRSRQPPT
jgi:hypothetical protein